MKKNQIVSAVGCFYLILSMILFYIGINSFENLYTCIFIFVSSLITLVTSFIYISSLRCQHCGEKLEIELFPSYNSFPKFFLWTGAEARCGHCHEKV